MGLHLLISLAFTIGISDIFMSTYIEYFFESESDTIVEELQKRG